MNWTTVPSRAVKPGGRRTTLPVTGILAALIVGVVGPAMGGLLPWLGEPTLVVAAGVVPLAIMALAPRRWWALRPIVAVVSVLILPGFYGGVARVLLASGLVLAAWVVADRPPVPLRRPSAPGTSAALVLLSAVTVMLGRNPATSRLALAVQALAIVVAVVSVKRTWPAGDRLHRTAQRLDAAITRMLLLVVGGAVLGARVLLAPVLARVLPVGGWVRSSRVDVDPRSLRAPRPGLRRVRWRVVGAALLLLVGVSAWRASDGLDPSRGSSPGSPANPAAIADPRDDAGSAEYREDIAWVTDERVAWRPVRFSRLLDVTTRTVNMSDGIRRSWTAPPCECRRLRVWMYGGSGAFGLGQRDQHTIASEFTRLAAADGYTLDLENHGGIGQLHWRNATRFSWDLTTDVPPDLVVFYDGAEEVEGELALVKRGLGNTLAPFEPYLTDLYDDLMDVPTTAPPVPRPEVTLLGWPTLDGADRPEGGLAADRYERSREMTRSMVAQLGIAAHYFWQPDRYSGTEDLAAADDPTRAAVFAGAPAMLADDVVDLSDLLAEADSSVFLDDTNLDERGARLVAEAMWRSLRPTVADLAAETPDE